MSFAAKYNKGSKFDIDTTGFEYRNLDTLKESQVIIIRGLFINEKRTKRKKWDSPVVIASDCYYNLPTYLTDQVRDMLADPETIQDINDGKCGMKRRNYTYKDADTGEDVDGIGVEWVDV